ncbi:DUF2971 domain-containing protein [Aeromonas salmonicida]|uniref:DUF2971 domain-containing protein n=1 Tax=Aeromonas salmonicida TaxID=645 RepID=UPI003434F327
MKVYKYLKSDKGAECVLVDGTLKFTSPKEFNDPFDCRLNFNSKNAPQYFLNKFKSYFDEQYGHLSPAEKLKKRKQIERMFNIGLTNGSLVDNLLSHVGICCFSKEPDNILMWSHYADHHKGFVIEFDVIDILDDTITVSSDFIKEPEYNLMLSKVNYSINMPTRTFRDEDPTKVSTMYFLTKAIDWEYENEYRCISHEKGAGIHHFNRELISRVLAGVKMPAADFARLKEIVNILSRSIGKDIPLIKATMLDGQYKLKIMP